MSDARETPSNGRVAHVSLEGKVTAERFVEGRPAFVAAPWTDLLREPAGARERQLLRGEGFTVLEALDAHAFGFAERDGYVGWIALADIGHPPRIARPTHWVAARQTYAKRTSVLKATEPPLNLSFGSRLCVTEEVEGWARISWLNDEAGRPGNALFVPAVHLRPLGDIASDPVAVARSFLGTPYLWGGNSAFGIDCSGLVQAAMLACGIACPGDSDQQAARLGEEIALDAERRPADLYFWAGHVGILSDSSTLLHANAHHMAVAEEPLEEVIARIARREGTGVLCRRRVSPPRG